MIREPLPLLITATIGIALASCSTAPKHHASPLHKARHDVDRAQRLLDDEPEEALALSLDAARTLLPQAKQEAKGPLPTPNTKGEMQLPEHLALYNRASAIAALAVREEPDLATGTNPPVVLTPNAAKELGRVEELVRSDEVKRRFMKRWFRDPGMGGELAAVWKPSKTEQPFVRARGYSYALTSLVKFDKEGRAILDIRPAAEERSVQLNGSTVPLAADLTAPYVVNYPQFSEFWSSLKWMLNTEVFPLPTGLTFMEPYDPDRIPLVLVHGLKSTAQMWRNIINEVGADPELSRHYQVWLFSYPTGLPVAASALTLRDELAKVDQIYKPRHDMVLMGHSMGGLLSRSQIINTDRVLWDAAFQERADQVFAKTKSEDLIRKALIFEANPDIDRVIFICVPHRGSKIAAGNLPSRLSAALIRLPLRIVTAIPAWTLDQVAPNLRPGGRRQLPTSVQSLDPNNPALQAAAKLPLQATHHSIIGDRGRGDTPNSSDGVVAYWSSHLDSAESELIVPANHGAFDHPNAIEEIKRILLLHAKEQGLR